MFTVKLSKKTLKDLARLNESGLFGNFAELISVLRQDPYTPPFEKLLGDYKGYCSRRINVQHRLVYKVNDETKSVYVVSAWTHYE